MKNKEDRFINEAERQEIIKAVKEIENETSGELVPMLVSQSHNYPQAIWRGSAILTFFSILVSEMLDMFFLKLWLPTWSMLALTAFFFLIYLLILRLLPSFRKLFILDKEIEAEVEKSAINSFYIEGLNKTVDETGILFYISMYEHKVWVLADKGINDKVSQDIWKKIASIISSGIKNRKTGAAIVEGIKECKNILKLNFPKKLNDTDELTNLIIKD